MIKVLIVDDHPIVRAGIRLLLGAAPDIDVAGEADSARMGLERSRAEPWDLVILDMGLPDADGLQLLKQMKLDQPARPVIVVTMALDGELAVRALRAGASSYLGKDSASSTIIEAIRRAMCGRPYVTDWLAEQLAVRVQHDAEQPSHTRLSDREFEILVSIAAGRRLTEIADQLSLSIKTISTYRSRILEKLNLSSNAELAVYAVRHHLLESTRSDTPGQDVQHP